MEKKGVGRVFPNAGFFLVIAFALPVCFAQCPDYLSMICPPILIDQWRVYEIQRTGDPILNNLIKLSYTENFFIFNETGTGLVTIASIRGCNNSGTPTAVIGTVAADNILVSSNTTIRSIFRTEGINKARQVTDSPGLCIYPDSFAIPILNPFLRMYYWNRVCPMDPDGPCPAFLNGDWEAVEPNGNSTLSFSITDGQTRTVYPVNGNSTQDYIYCAPLADGSYLLRTMQVAPSDQLGNETRTIILPTPTGFKMIVNPSGDCTYPNGTSRVDGFLTYVVSSIVSTSPPTPNLTSNKTSIIVGVVVGGVGFIVLIVAIVVIAYFVTRKKQIPLHADLMRPSQSGSVESAGGYNIPVELLPYKSSGHSSLIVSGDRSWEIDFNELVLEEEIGSGSFGIVWKGQWRNTEVAVKQMKGQMNQKQLEGFQQEALLLGKLRPHNNVMLFLGVCTTPYPCIVTELLSGGSLFDLLQKGDIELDRKLKLAMDICSGMAHLHSENIIHRDLATRNVLLADNSTGKIADFGMSRALEGTSGGAQTLSSIGPVKWMSPEALNERKYSVFSDVWSFGVTLWEMWAREEPFAHLDATQAAIRIARDNLTLQRPEDCPDEVWNIMQQTWRVTKEERPNFSNLFKAFSNLQRELGAVATERYVPY